jgi:hypothetical protein
MSAWFWQVPAAAAVPAAMYGLCRANDRGYKVERVFNGWAFPAVVIAYIGWVFWKDEGPLSAVLAVVGLTCIVVGGSKLLRRARLRECGAECHRKLPPSKFAPGALSCRDCVAVRRMSRVIAHERAQAAVRRGGLDGLIAFYDSEDGQPLAADEEAKRRLGLENAW